MTFYTACKLYKREMNHFMIDTIVHFFWMLVLKGPYISGHVTQNIIISKCKESKDVAEIFLNINWRNSETQLTLISL